MIFLLLLEWSKTQNAIVSFPCGSLNSNFIYRTSQCAPCYYPCISCSGILESQCSQCISGFFLTSNSCIPCIYGCGTCSSATLCSTCSDGFYLLNSICQPCQQSNAETCNVNGISTSCLDGSFYDNSINICTSCDDSGGCNTCNSISICSSCINGFYLNTDKCVACQANCNTCTNTQCSACKIGFTAQSINCIENNITITNCQFENTNQVCLLCQKGYYLQNGVCIHGCSLLCEFCTGPSSIQCFSIGSNRFCSQLSFSIIETTFCTPRFYFTTNTVLELYYTAMANTNIFSPSGNFLNNLFRQKVVGGSNSIQIDLVFTSTPGSSAQFFFKVYMVNGTCPTYKYTAVDSSTQLTGNITCTLSLLGTGLSGTVQFTYLTLSINQLSPHDKLQLTVPTSSQIGLAEVIIKLNKCIGTGCAQCQQDNICLLCYDTSHYKQEVQCVSFCSSNYFTYEVNRQCVTFCPAETYLQLSSLSCLPCISPCINCQSQTQCTSCGIISVTTYFLSGTNCITNCPSQFYGQTATNICQSCISPCFTCSSLTICLSCATGFLDGTECLLDCGTGKYSILPNAICGTCTSPCATCQFSATNCITCIVNTYFKDNQCITQTICQMQKRFLVVNTLCSACDPSCITCQTTISNCLSCNSNFGTGDGNCSPTCPNLFYADAKTMSCKKCPEQCLLCVSQQQCSSCTPLTNGTNYFYNGITCVNTCPDQFYGNTTLKQCVNCPSICFTCSSSTVCLSCLNRYLLNGQCVSANKCLTKQFANTLNLKCQDCNISCSTCITTKNNCLSCTNQDHVLSNGICSTTCTDGFYKQDNICLSCISPCLTCTGPASCLTCLNGFLKVNISCVDRCPDGYYFSNNNCVACTDNCIKCTSTICLACAVGFAFTNCDTCVQTCPTKFYMANNGYCQSCQPPCTTCSGLNFCTSCINGLAYNGQCIENCPFGFYDTTGNCVQCDTNCLSCVGKATTCTSCPTNNFLDINVCRTTCPKTKYIQISTSTCNPCQFPCLSCQSTFSKCLTCSDGLVLSNNNCLVNCPSNNYPDENNVCQTCSQQLNCNICKSATQCTSCKNNYFLNSNNSCLTTCQEGYFPSEGQCLPCRSPCKTCSNTHCLTCNLPFIYYQPQQSCLSQCPVGFYSNQSICNNCQQMCSICTSATNCLSCSTGVANDGKCISNCPDKFFNNNGRCQQCSNNCETCSSLYICLTCKIGFLDSGYCYSTCIQGKYPNQQNVCQSCASTCLTCIFKADSCTSCISGQLLYKFTCVDTCPTLFYTVGSNCQRCPPPCYDCSSSTSCTSCRFGYVLYNQNECVIGPPCPNNLFYQSDQQSCVTLAGCGTALKQIILRICGSTCPPDRYNNGQGFCVQDCGDGFFVDSSLHCQNLSTIVNTDTPLIMQPILLQKDNLLFLKINFNQTVNYSKIITENDISIQFIPNVNIIQQSRLLQSSIQISKQIVTINPLQVQLITTQNLIDGRLSVKLVNSTTFMRAQTSNIPLYPIQEQLNLEFYYFYDLSDRQTGSYIQNISQSIVASMLIILLILIFMNRGSQAYLVMDTLQLIFLLAFLNIQYPPNLNGAIYGFRYSVFSFLPNIFSDAYSTIPISQSLGKFSSIIVDSSFLRNIGFNFIIIFVLVTLFIIVKISLFCLKQKTTNEYVNYYKNICLKIFLRFRWHYTNDYFFLTFFNVCLFFFAQMQHFGDSSAINVVSIIFWIIFGILYAAFPIFIAYKLKRHFNNIRKGKRLTNLLCFTRGLRKDDGFAISLILIRFLRKLVICIGIGLLGHNPLYVLPLLTAPSVLLLFFIFITKPYIKKISNIFNILTQIIVILLLIILTVLAAREGFDTSNDKLIIGWIGVAIIFIVILMHSAYIAAMLFFQQSMTDQEEIGDEKQIDDDDDQLNSEDEYGYIDRYGIVITQSDEFGSDQEEFIHYSQSSDDDDQFKSKEKNTGPKILIKLSKNIQ